MEKKPIITTGRLVELIFSGVLIVCLFLASLTFESTPLTNLANGITQFFGGKVDSSTLKESLSVLDIATINKNMMVVMLLFVALCLTNMVLKFRHRARWMTFLVMLCGLLWMVTVVAARQELRKNTIGLMNTEFGLGFWFLLIALIGLFVGLFIPEPEHGEESAVHVVRSRWPYFCGGFLLAVLMAVGVYYFLRHRDYQQQQQQPVKQEQVSQSPSAPA